MAARVSDSEPALRPGRVARVDRGTLTAVTARGVQRLPTRGHSATTGDWILISPTPTPNVAVVLPRWSALGRQDPGPAGGTQLLAANVDVVLIAVGLDRGLNRGRLERLLTLAWASGAVPAVVLTKADLVTTGEQTATDAEQTAIWVDVVLASSRTGQGIEHLRALIPAGRTAVLLGESGAGKSSLINALIEDEVQATETVREGDHKGRHTTHARELVALPHGGVLLDTPGIRGVGLEVGHEDGLDLAFADVVALASSCRFRDCQHLAEPGCAVEAAVADGRLDAQRLASFQSLHEEVASAARRADVRADRAATKSRGRRQKHREEQWDAERRDDR